MHTPAGRRGPPAHPPAPRPMALAATVALATVVAAVVAGCAAMAAEVPAAGGPAATPRGLATLPPPGMALVVELAQDSTDTAVLASRLQAVAGLPVQALRPLGPRRWAFNLLCDGRPADCDAAHARLKAATTLVRALEPDLPVPRPARPSGEPAR